MNGPSDTPWESLSPQTRLLLARERAQPQERPSRCICVAAPTELTNHAWWCRASGKMQQ